jgi:membrane protein DedA with SNARE-associated domain
MARRRCSSAGWCHWQFLSLTTLGSLIWNSVFVVAGYLLGANWQVVDEYAGIFQAVVIAAVAVATVLFIAVRVRDRKRSKSNVE